MIPTRRQWLRTATMLPAYFTLRAARKDFWNTKDPANWTADEKQTLLFQSPWAQGGYVRMEGEKKGPSLGYNRQGQRGVDMPDVRPTVGPTETRSVPIGGDTIPPPPKPESGPPIEFPALARWETAKPVRLAGGPEVPELTGKFYVIRLRGLPLLPPKAGQTDSSRNAAMLDAIKDGSVLERKNKPAIRCAHLFAGSGTAATEVLLFFPRDPDPIMLADKVVTLDSSFAFYHLSIKFSLKEMVYRGELTL